MTFRMVEAGFLVGIEVFDHVVVSPDGSHTSIYEYHHKTAQNLADNMLKGMLAGKSLLETLPPELRGRVEEALKENPELSQQIKKFNPLGPIDFPYPKIDLKKPPFLNKDNKR